ncbi:MAG TPA: MotA/TolQ/ExbB proton channel family protein [Kofleriaceae bacterium]|jgi:biopolymer transport protein ExbB|nr:MotA/TolQ/ExbB proton channel family protein [Kofleriaceae bacterium]
MWVIVAFSVLAITVALERLVVHWRFIDRARALADTVRRCLTRGALEEGRSACERSQSALADVFLVGYERLGRAKKENLEAAVHRERIKVATALKNHLWILATIGVIAPFVGLFGTVLGIIDAFQELQGVQQGGLDVVSGGISVALYATAFGIFVAVEAVILYNFFNQRLARTAVELRMMTDEFLELLDEHGPGSQEQARALTGSDPDKDSKRHGSREAA